MCCKKCLKEDISGRLTNVSSLSAWNKVSIYLLQWKLQQVKYMGLCLCLDIFLLKSKSFLVQCFSHAFAGLMLLESSLSSTKRVPKSIFSLIPSVPHCHFRVAVLPLSVFVIKACCLCNGEAFFLIPSYSPIWFDIFPYAVKRKHTGKMQVKNYSVLSHFGYTMLEHLKPSSFASKTAALLFLSHNKTVF